MTLSPPDENGIQPASRIYGNDTHNNWPLELIWLGEHNGRDVGEHLEHVLERSLNGRESSTVEVINFLYLQSASSLQLHTRCLGAYILDESLGTNVVTPEPNPADCDANR
jgi:hypothetical protein